MSTTLWHVTRLLSSVSAPYDVVVPYSTCDVAGSLVVHEIVAERLVTLDELTAEIVGAVVSSVTVSVTDADQLPIVSLNCT